MTTISGIDKVLMRGIPPPKKELELLVDGMGSM